MVDLGKRDRGLSRVQMYIKKYYPTIGPIVMKEWKEYLDGPKDEGMKQVWIAFLTDFGTKRLKKASAEVHAEVDRLMERQAKGELFLLEDEMEEPLNEASAEDKRLAAEATLRKWNMYVNQSMDWSNRMSVLRSTMKSTNLLI